VLDHGETIAQGPPELVRKHPKVLAAYLGEDAEEDASDAPRPAHPGHGAEEPPAAAPETTELS
jgi:branched-chain amino acid transport system ATP-binding protein